VYRDRFRDALAELHRTNNFPEFTGRLCPAPCEAACVLEIDQGNAVTIKQIELAIVSRGWDEGWIVPQPPATRTGRSVAVAGRGLGGVHFAMEYLYQRNRDLAGGAQAAISAAGRHVIVIGGGDTGADCVASAHREGAASVTQIELLGEPPEHRPDDVTPWPLW